MDTDGLGDLIDRAIGIELRAQRDGKHFTRAELHALSGVSAKTIQRFEEGTRSPDMKQLGALCRALGLSMREFIATALKDVEGDPA